MDTRVVFLNEIEPSENCFSPICKGAVLTVALFAIGLVGGYLFYKNLYFPYAISAVTLSGAGLFALLTYALFQKCCISETKKMQLSESYVQNMMIQKLREDNQLVNVVSTLDFIKLKEVIYKLNETEFVTVFSRLMRGFTPERDKIEKMHLFIEFLTIHMWQAVMKETDQKEIEHRMDQLELGLTIVTRHTDISHSIDAFLCIIKTLDAQLNPELFRKSEDEFLRGLVWSVALITEWAQKFGWLDPNKHLDVFQIKFWEKLIHGTSSVGPITACFCLEQKLYEDYPTGNKKDSFTKLIKLCDASWIECTQCYLQEPQYRSMIAAVYKDAHDKAKLEGSRG